MVNVSPALTSACSPALQALRDHTWPRGLSQWEEEEHSPYSQGLQVVKRCSFDLLL